MPLSRRYTGDGQTYQLFQRVLLKAASGGQPEPAALLDELHVAGLDSELAARGIPALELPVAGATSAEAWTERVARLLGDHPGLRAYLDARPAARRLLGMPTSNVHDVGAFLSIRFQNGALQLWKQDVAWAAAGTVTPVNIGQLAVEVGHINGEALAPEQHRYPTR